MLLSEPINPGGHAAWGALVKIDGHVIYSDGGYCGQGPKMSNNVAEYSAFLSILAFVGDRAGSLVIRMDSKLVVEQINGRWRIHGGLYVPFYMEALARWKTQQAIRGKQCCSLLWIPREQNSECDRLSKDVLLNMGISFRIQPEQRAV